MKIHRRATILTATAISTLALIGAPTGPVAHADSGAVTIANFSFTPGTLNVPVGSTVQWTNKDEATHTVTSDTGAFDSGNVVTGGNYTFTFSSAGTFAYHCKIHPGMTGSIVVSAVAAATNTPLPTATQASGGGQPTTVPPPPATPTNTSGPPTNTPQPTATNTPTSPPAQPLLSLSIKPTTLSIGKTISLSIDVKSAKTKKAVKGAKISLNGKKAGFGTIKATTDKKGHAVLSGVYPKKVGSAALTVARSGFKTAHKTLKVSK